MNRLYVILQTYNSQEAKNDVERQNECGNKDSGADEPPDNQLEGGGPRTILSHLVVPHHLQPLTKILTVIYCYLDKYIY